MSGTFTMPPQASANVGNPPAGYYRYFIGDGTDNTTGVFYRKDSAGAVVPLIPTAYTDEMAQDAIASMLNGDGTVTLAYNDPANTYAVTRAAITGDVSIPGGSNTATIGAGKVTNAMHAQMPASTIKGNNGGGAAVPSDLTPAQIKALLGTQSSDVSDFVEAAQDAVAGMLNGDGTVSLVYNDPANTYAVSRAAITGDVAIPSGSNAATIGPSKVTNAMLAQMAAMSLKGNITGGAANPVDVTQAQVTAFLGLATQVLQGAMSAMDKAKLDNLWFDVTNYGISPANSGTVNVTAWNALYAILPVNCVVFFPPGTYDFASELTLSRNLQCMIMGAGKSRSILRTTSTTAHLFNFSINAYYYSFEELGFTSSVTKTAGAAVCSTFDNALMDVRRCHFFNCFIGLDLSGVGSANVGTISECIFDQPVPGGYQLRINGANINTMLTNITINVTGVNCIGLEINQSGAVQVVGCDIIGGANSCRLNATGVISAVFFVNTFFDQATLGSTVKIMGTFATSRIKFLQCGITNGAAGLAALEIAGTGTGTGIPEAIDFHLCDFYNNGFGGTTTGLLITGVRGIDLKSSRVSGFTIGVDLYPYGAAGVTNFNIQNNTIGPTENFAGNGIGIRINAGAFAYGPSIVAANDLSGNTTAPIQDNGTYTQNLMWTGNNFGMVVAPKAMAPGALIATAATLTKVGASVPIPASALRPGTSIRMTVWVTNAATINTVTPALKFGTADSNADATIAGGTALTAGTAVVGAGRFIIELYALSATQVMASVAWQNNANGITGTSAAANAFQNTAAPVTVANTANAFLGFYLQCSVANIVTVRTQTFEVMAQ